jgi:hypothetical protein
MEFESFTDGIALSNRKNGNVEEKIERKYTAVLTFAIFRQSWPKDF